MFFEKECFSFSINQVIEIKQTNVNLMNRGRDFCGLSFRTRADTILRSDREENHIEDNTIVYIPAGLDYRRIAKIDEMIVVRLDKIDYESDRIECLKPKNSALFAELFSKILHLWNKKEIGYKHRCAAILHEIFAECYLECYAAEPAPSKIQKSVDYINHSFSDNSLTVAAAAARSFMSEVYFRRLFREEYGVSPRRYLITLRIQNAARLIATGYYSLSEAAYMSGYTDYKYFSTEFKRVIGISPSEYALGHKA